MIFPCSKCGECCRHINLIPELKQFDSGNGACIHLSAENLCEIYDQRPDICNVDVMYEKYYSHMISEDEYIALNIQGCAALRKLDR